MADRVAKEFRVRFNLKYDREILCPSGGSFGIPFHIGEGQVRDIGRWPVAGHLSRLLPIEKWVSDFIPGTDMMNMTVVWPRLPRLPIEYRDKKLDLGDRRDSREAFVHGWIHRSTEEVGTCDGEA